MTDGSHVRKLPATFALLNPKHAARIDSFKPAQEGVITAAKAKDRAGFAAAFKPLP